MRAEHLEILVEEPSTEAFLRELLPRLIAGRATFEIYPYQGKDDLLAKLPSRLRGYAPWLPENWRLVVLVDRDNDDCEVLKQKMERMAVQAGLRTKSVSRSTAWSVVNRLAIEELEAWFFGDWQAVRRAYPKVPATIPQKQPYRDPDTIAGGTWEAFERVLQRGGYFRSGLRKTEVARAIGRNLDPVRNSSRSFRAFRDALLEAVA